MIKYKPYRGGAPADTPIFIVIVKNTNPWEKAWTSPGYWYSEAEAREALAASGQEGYINSSTRGETWDYYHNRDYMMQNDVRNPRDR